MAYCDSEDIARYCATAESADIDGAISYAQAVIDTYTNDIHEPFDDSTLNIVVGRSGVAYLGKTTRAVTAVSYTDDGSDLDDSICTFENVKHPAIRLTGQASPNLLIVGLEPWQRLRPWSGTRLTVTADIGPEETPAAIREATAVLASRFLCAAGFAAEAAPLTAHPAREVGVAAIAVEGYSVTYSGTTGESSTTGVPTIDRLLTPYRRAVSRWS